MPATRPTKSSSSTEPAKPPCTNHSVAGGHFPDPRAKFNPYDPFASTTLCGAPVVRFDLTKCPEYQPSNEADCEKKVVVLNMVPYKATSTQVAHALWKCARVTALDIKVHVKERQQSSNGKRVHEHRSGLRFVTLSVDDANTLLHTMRRVDVDGRGLLFRTCTCGKVVDVLCATSAAGVQVLVDLAPQLRLYAPRYAPQLPAYVDEPGRRRADVQATPVPSTGAREGLHLEEPPVPEATPIVTDIHHNHEHVDSFNAPSPTDFDAYSEPARDVHNCAPQTTLFRKVERPMAAQHQSKSRRVI